MTAKDRILGKIRRAVAAGAGAEDAARRAAVAARLSAPAQSAPTPVQARVAPEALADAFTRRAEAAAATVSRIADIADLPAALSDQLRRRNLGQAVRMGADPALAGLDWGGLDTSTGPGRIEEPATLSVARFGVAETGSAVLLSGPENPVTLTFLGESHFIVLPEAAIRPGLDEMWAALRTDGADPRTVNIVTGPSRSADIGQKLQLGAHGPVAVHIFLVAADFTAR